MKGDVVGWMDSCPSVCAFRSSESQGRKDHRMEMISACGYPGKMRDARLGYVLTQEMRLKAKATEVKPFTLANLYRSILGNYMKRNSK
jgi:hypothetical protein